MNQRFFKARVRAYMRVGAWRTLYRVLDAAPAQLHGYRTGLPFIFLDHLLSAGQVDNVARLVPFKGFLAANQPMLFQAILDGFEQGDAGLLDALIRDGDLHPLTRFEAMGWANVLRHGQFSKVKRRNPKYAVTCMQFWDTAEVPLEILAGSAQWSDVFGTSHQMFSDAQAHDFITDHYGTHLAAQYDGLWHPALKSDVFRLCYLAVKGGVYVDADAEARSMAKHLPAIAGDDLVLSAMTSLPNCATINGMMVAKPDHPLVTGLLDQVWRNLSEQSHRKIFWLSGPGAVTQFLYRNGGAAKIFPQKATSEWFFQQFDAPYKYTERNWRVFEHETTARDEDVLPDLLADLSEAGNGD